jgi:hypothetical protein
MNDPLQLTKHVTAPAELKLVITLDSTTGQVNVNGPINDRIFCFGLLEMAKEAINAYSAQQQKQIMVARPFPMVKQ